MPEPEMAEVEIYEPWLPKRGDLVRVRISPECEGCANDRTVAADLNGMISVVCADGPCLLFPKKWHDCSGPRKYKPNHRWQVHFKPSVPCSGGLGRWWWSAAFAAVELEPMSALWHAEQPRGGA